MYVWWTLINNTSLLCLLSFSSSNLSVYLKFGIQSPLYADCLLTIFQKVYTSSQIISIRTTVHWVHQFKKK